MNIKALLVLVHDCHGLQWHFETWVLRWPAHEGPTPAAFSPGHHTHFPSFTTSTSKFHYRLHTPLQKSIKINIWVTSDHSNSMGSPLRWFWFWLPQTSGLTKQWLKTLPASQLGWFLDWWPARMYKRFPLNSIDVWPSHCSHCCAHLHIWLRDHHEMHRLRLTQQQDTRPSRIHGKTGP